MTLEIKAKYPIEWNRKYFLIGSKEKSVFAPCVACDNKGKIEIKGKEYTCPRCNGNWRQKEVIPKVRRFHVEKYKLERIEIAGAENRLGQTVQATTNLRFKQDKVGRGYSNSVLIREKDFDTMKIDSSINARCLMNDYKEALRLMREANAAEKIKEKEANLEAN